MPTPTRDFFYDLPNDRIAQTPAEPRDTSRLFVLDRGLNHSSPPSQGGVGGGCLHFYTIIDELREGDVLVFNVSKVFKARFMIGGFEVFVLKVRDGEIDALVRGSRKLRGKHRRLGDFEVISIMDDGIVTMKTQKSAAAMFAYCEANGTVPTPPYITAQIERGTGEDNRYQTVYAKTVGSVAAPTAGLHFTPELLDRIRAKGVQIEEVTLHVGIGTFRPVHAVNIEDHVMHAEYVEIDQSTAGRINIAKTEGRRIIAVGTTTARVLEGVAARTGVISAFSGELNIFITPGFEFRVMDGLITNFHLPQSTLLMLVCAFAGRERVLAAYQEAIALGYRFFSFGDAMFIR